MVPAATNAAALETLVRSQIDRLRDDKEAALDAIDSHEQELASLGMPLTEDAITRRLRKTETALNRVWRTTLEELDKARAEAPRTESNNVATRFPVFDADPPRRSTVSDAALEYMARRAEDNAAAISSDIMARARWARAEAEVAAELEDVAATLAELEAEFEAQESMATPVIEPTPTPIPIPTPPTSIPTPAQALAPASISTPSTTRPRVSYTPLSTGNRRQRRAIESELKREARKEKARRRKR